MKSATSILKYFIIIFSILALVVFVVYAFLNPDQIANLKSAIFQNSLLDNIINIEQVIAPAPLRFSGGTSGKLDQTATINETNKQRVKNGKSELTENTLLDQAAELKLQDMADNQYFEHVSPSGRGPSDLARSVDYAYVVIGENLALGNFETDAALLDAWMNSPGHRENILNPRYTQIGVAVGQVTYQGHKTWMAVQEFGKPQSACPVLDQTLKAKIASEQADLNAEDGRLQSERAHLQSEHPQTSEEVNAYNAEVESYNAGIAHYRAAAARLKSDIENYNVNVRAYNACIVS